MSVTLILQDDLAALLQAEAAQQRRPLPDVAATLLRRALTAGKPDSGAPQAPFRIQPHAGTLVSGIHPCKLNQLADELSGKTLLSLPSR